MPPEDERSTALHDAEAMVAATTPEACGALVKQIREHPEFFVTYCLRHFEHFRKAVALALDQAGGFDDPQIREIMKCLLPHPHNAEELEATYNRASGMVMPGQDPFAVLVELVKFNNRASEMLRAIASDSD